MIASIDGGQMDQSDWPANNRSTRPSEAEIDSSCLLDSKNPIKGPRTFPMKEISSRGGVRGIRGGCGGRGFSRNQSRRFDLTPPSNKMDSMECSFDKHKLSNKQPPMKSYVAAVKKAIPLQAVSVDNLVATEDVPPVQNNTEICEQLNLSNTELLAALEHCRTDFPLLVKKRKRTSLDTNALLVLLSGYLDVQDFPSFVWQIFNINQVDKLSQILAYKNSNRLYVKIPSKVRLEETLQYYGILRQIGVKRDAPTEQHDFHQAFKNDLMTADFDIKGNVIVFSFKSAYLCKHWRNKVIFIRGFPTKLCSYDANLKLNNQKGAMIRVQHDMNYSITLLKVDSGITFSNLKTFFTDCLQLNIVKLEHAIHPIYKTKDMTSWLIEFDQFDCPEVLYKKTKIIFNTGQFYIKHNRFFFNAPCFRCASARHSISRCPQKEELKIWEENILTKAFNFNDRQLSRSFRKQLRNCETNRDLLEFLDRTIEHELPPVVKSSHLQKTVSFSTSSLPIECSVKSNPVLRNYIHPTVRTCLNWCIGKVIEAEIEIPSSTIISTPSALTSESFKGKPADKSLLLSSKDVQPAPLPNRVQISKYESINSSMEEKLAPIFQKPREVLRELVVVENQGDCRDGVITSSRSTTSTTVPLPERHLKRKSSSLPVFNVSKKLYSTQIVSDHYPSFVPKNGSFQLGKANSSVKNSPIKVIQAEDVASPSFTFKGKETFDLEFLHPETPHDQFLYHPFIPPSRRAECIERMGLRQVHIPPKGHCMWIAALVAHQGHELVESSHLNLNEERALKNLQRKVYEEFQNLSDVTIQHCYVPLMDDTFQNKYGTNPSINVIKDTLRSYFNTIINTPSSEVLSEQFWGSTFGIELIVRVLQRPVYILNFDYSIKISTITCFSIEPSTVSYTASTGISQRMLPRSQWFTIFHKNKASAIVLHYLNGNHFNTLLSDGDQEGLVDEIPSTLGKNQTQLADATENVVMDNHNEQIQVIETAVLNVDREQISSSDELFQDLSGEVKQAAIERLEKWNIADVYEYAKQNDIAPHVAAKKLEEICAVSAQKSVTESLILGGMDIVSPSPPLSSSYATDGSIPEGNRSYGSQESLCLSPNSKCLQSNAILIMQSLEDKEFRVDKVKCLTNDLLTLVEKTDKLETILRTVSKKTPTVRTFTNMVFEHANVVKRLVQNTKYPLLFLRQFSKIALVALGKSILCDNIVDLLQQTNQRLSNNDHQAFVMQWKDAITSAKSPNLAFVIATSSEKWKRLH